MNGREETFHQEMVLWKKLNTPDLVNHQAEDLYEQSTTYEEGQEFEEDPSIWDISLDPDDLGFIGGGNAATMNAPPLLTPGGVPQGFTPEQENEWRNRVAAYEHSLPRVTLEKFRQLGEAEIGVAKLPVEVASGIYKVVTDPVGWWEESKLVGPLFPKETDPLVRQYIEKKQLVDGKPRGIPTEAETSAFETAFEIVSQNATDRNLGWALGSAHAAGGVPGRRLPTGKPTPSRIIKPGEVAPPKVAPEIVIPGEVAPKIAPKIELVSKYKKPIPLEVARASKDWMSGKYKVDVLADINKLPELPELSTGVLTWKPPTAGYQNPFTRNMYKVWDGLTSLWDRKAPIWARTHRNKQIAELTLERQRIVDGLNASVRDDIIKPLAKLTIGEKKAIGLMVNKNIPVPESSRPFIQNVDARIGQLGKSISEKYSQWVEDGAILPAEAKLAEETWLRHLGEYSRSRYLQPTVTKGKPPQIAPRPPLSEKVIQQSMFKKKLTEYEWGERALAFEGRSPKEIANMAAKEVERIGLEAKKQAGWVYQGDVMLDWTFKDLHNNYSTMLWQDAIRKDPTLFSTTPKPGFVSIADAKILPARIIRDPRLGPLNQGYINPGLADELKLFVKYGENRPHRFFSEALGWWKGAKVAGNPATVVRNYLSGGLLQTDMAGYPVWYPQNMPTYARSATQYIAKGDRYKFWHKHGLYGADYYSVEIAPGFAASLEADPMAYLTLGDKFARTSQTIKRKAFSYYGSIDHIHRTYLAENAFRHGASPAQAVHFANKWQLDYRFVAPIVERARSGFPGFFFPFVSFPALMTPRIGEVLATRPWVLAKYPITLNLVNQYNMNRLGLDKETLEAAKPDFLKNDPYSIVIGKDEHNQPEFLSVGYIFPFGSWKTGFIDTEQWGNMSSGGLAGGVNTLITGYDPYTKTKLFNPGDPASVKREKVASYALRLFGPGAVTHALNIYDASTGKQAGFPTKMPRSLRQTLLRAAGISIYSGGANTIMLKLWLKQRSIEDQRKALGSVLRNPNYSQEEKNRLKEETLSSVQNERAEIRNLFRALSQLRTDMPIKVHEDEELRRTIMPFETPEKVYKDKDEQFLEEMRIWKRAKLEKATK